MRNKIRQLLPAFVCLLATTVFLGCAHYRGDGTIEYSEYPSAPFLTKHWRKLDLPAFDLSQAQERTYSLAGLPRSKSIEVSLVLSPREDQNIRCFNAFIILRIIAKNGLVAFAQMRRLPKMGFIDDVVPKAIASASFFNLGSVTLKAGGDYRLEMKYHPEGTNVSSGDGKVELSPENDEQQAEPSIVTSR